MRIPEERVPVHDLTFINSAYCWWFSFNVQLDVIISKELVLIQLSPYHFHKYKYIPISSSQTALCFSNSTCQDKIWVLFVLSSTSAVSPIHFSCINLIDETNLMIWVINKTDSHRAPASNLLHEDKHLWNSHIFNKFPIQHIRRFIHPYLFLMVVGGKKLSENLEVWTYQNRFWLKLQKSYQYKFASSVTLSATELNAGTGMILAVFEILADILYSSETEFSAQLTSLTFH